VVGEASAKRFGGSKSFGKQRESVSQQTAPKAPATALLLRCHCGNKWLASGWPGGWRPAGFPVHGTWF